MAKGSIAEFPHAAELPPAPDIPERWPLDATCGTVVGKPGSTTGGARGAVRFEIPTVAAGIILASIGQRSYALSFAGLDLGEHYTASKSTGRPDSKGASRSFVDFVAPEDATTLLGELFVRELIGKKGILVLRPGVIEPSNPKVARGQIALDDAAEDESGDDLLPES